MCHGPYLGVRKVVLIILEQDVPGSQILMDDPSSMQVFHRLCGLMSQAQYGAHARCIGMLVMQGASVQSFPQRSCPTRQPKPS